MDKRDIDPFSFNLELNNSIQSPIKEEPQKQCMRNIPILMA